MRALCGSLLLLLALGSCSPEREPAPGAVGAPDADAAASPAPGPAGWVVTERGIGPLVVGVSLQEAGLALGQEIRPAYDVFEECDMVPLPEGPSDVTLMIVSDTVVRVDVFGSSTVATAEGAGIGDSEARVRSLYGPRVREEPHKYTDGRYLIVPLASDTTLRLVFETEVQGRVTRYRAGLLPSVEWVEGCA
jgi:hypothetical protein